MGKGPSRHPTPLEALRTLNILHGTLEQCWVLYQIQDVPAHLFLFLPFAVQSTQNAPVTSNWEMLTREGQVFEHLVSGLMVPLGEA